MGIVKPSGELKRRLFRSFLQRHYSLRLHMFLILSGVFCFGLLASKLLLLFDLRNMLLRYPLVVLLSYGAFFCFMKLWLVYLSSSSGQAARDNAGGSRLRETLQEHAVDIPDIGSAIADMASSYESAPLRGGDFGGAGISSSFRDASGGISEFAASDAGGGTGSEIAGSAGNAVSGIFDSDDAGWVLLVLAVVLAVVFGSGIYLIYEAPVILSDAAFQALLSTSLIRRMKKMSEPDWLGGIFRATAVPFLAVLAAATAAAWVMRAAYPEALRMSDVVWPLLGNLFVMFF